MTVASRSAVADHYANSRLVAAIRDGLAQLGKTDATVTGEDLAPVDEFHIGGRVATAAVAQRLELTTNDRVLDVGCGLGGAARQVAQEYGCHVTGIDLTADYVEAGNVLSNWLKLETQVHLQQGNALALPFADGTFTAAYMLHVGMNIADKRTLFAGVLRVLSSSACFAIYDVMRTGDGDLSYPLPWASTVATNAIATPTEYREALVTAGFEIISERERRDVALAYFARQREQAAAAGGPPPIGVHTLMGERRPEMVRNMSESVKTGRIAPVEIVARKT